MCTGNICRSPMAEGLLRHRLSEQGVDARVHSAGLLFDDRPASDDAVDVMADLGIDIGPHRSRKLTEEMIEDADLVLGLTREHVREAALLVPEALGKTFTLKEVVRRGERVGRRRADEALAGWLKRVAAGRKRTDILGASDDDDVADPIGRPRSFYENTLNELTDLVDRLVDVAVAGPPLTVTHQESLMRVAIGSDHAGFELKQHLIDFIENLGHKVDDFGTDSTEPVDYPEFCAAVARAVAKGEADRGIVLGGSGQGEQMVANKVRGARAALCNDLYTARLSREHNDANVLSMGGRIVAFGLADEIVKLWLTTEFEGGRHIRRLEQIAEIEEQF